MTTTGLGTFELIDLMTGYQQAAALTAGARLGLFDTLRHGPASAQDLAGAAGSDPSATRALADALVELGVLVAVDGGYAGTPASARLAGDGDLRLVVEKEAFLSGVWQHLTDTVRAGTPRLDPWAQRLVEDPDTARTFLRALVVLAIETGPDLTRVPGVGPGARVADLGGAFGSYAVPLAAAGAAVTLADLPPVVAWAVEELAGVDPEVRERITPVAVDLLAGDAAGTLGGDFDVVLLSHLLHELDDADCARVLDLARRICRPGGLVVVFELPGQGPGAFGPLFDLMMRVETPGRARHLDELVKLMESAGLADVRVSPEHPLPHAVLLATP